MRWVDQTLKLRRPATGAPLRAGLWLESRRGLPWVAETIRSIRSTLGLELVAVFSDEAADPGVAPGGLLWRLYQQRNLRTASGDEPLRPLDLGPCLEGVAVRPAADLNRKVLAELNLDVLISLVSQPRSGDCQGWARYGVWSFAFGARQYSRLPFYFWEIEQGDAVSELVLLLHPERLEEGRVIYRYQAATRPGWQYATNAVEPLSMAAVVVIRRLLDVQEGGWDALTGLPVWREGPVPVRPRAGYPGTWTLVRFLAARLAHQIQRHIIAWRGEPKWFVCLRRNRESFLTRRPRFQPDGFTAIPNPAHSTLADPFLIRREGRTFLFVEEIVTATSRGHLSACEVLPGGLAPFVQVLRKPFHVSYPCVLELDGEVFLLPETAENRTVELYRAEEFPRRWQLVKEYQTGIVLVDTTPFFHQGVWYFFTSTVDEITGCWLETWLFYSDRLDGAWRYHPRNPICSDARRARSAGHLLHRHGQLIRPAQDCTVRYGYAITLNEVLALSPTEYEERLAEVILPNWMPGIFASHTLNALDDIEVIDATRIPQSRL